MPVQIKLLLDFYARDDNRGRHNDHLAGHHSIQTNQQPTSVIPIFMPDAHPAATLPLYPGTGQAPNMLACMTSGVIKWWKKTEGEPSISGLPGVPQQLRYLKFATQEDSAIQSQCEFCSSFFTAAACLCYSHKSQASHHISTRVLSFQPHVHNRQLWLH